LVPFLSPIGWWEKKNGDEKRLEMFLLTIKFNPIICLQNDQWEEHHKIEWLTKCLNNIDEPYHLFFFNIFPNHLLVHHTPKYQTCECIFTIYS
jgi:hypothetical protein